MEEVGAVEVLGFDFGGLRGGVGDSVSVPVGVGWAESCLCFFCWRFSLRLCGSVGCVNVGWLTTSQTVSLDVKV
jgi:hypothetical protein